MGDPPVPDTEENTGLCISIYHNQPGFQTVYTTVLFQKETYRGRVSALAFVKIKGIATRNCLR